MALVPEHLGRCQDLTSAETLVVTGFVYTCKFFRTAVGAISY
jgi:hypothetical protein